MKIGCLMFVWNITRDEINSSQFEFLQRRNWWKVIKTRHIYLCFTELLMAKDSPVKITRNSIITLGFFVYMK